MGDYPAEFQKCKKMKVTVRCSEREEDGGGRREMKKISGKKGRVENINNEGTLK
jgi:hypothetical protein